MARELEQAGHAKPRTSTTHRNPARASRQHAVVFQRIPEISELSLETIESNPNSAWHRPVHEPLAMTSTRGYDQTHLCVMRRKLRQGKRPGRERRKVN
jgi:hypothetical protein